MQGRSQLWEPKSSNSILGRPFIHVWPLWLTATFFVGKNDIRVVWLANGEFLSFLKECNNPKEWSWKLYVPGGRHLDMWGLVLASFQGSSIVGEIHRCLAYSECNTRVHPTWGIFFHHFFAWKKTTRELGSLGGFRAHLGVPKHCTFTEVEIMAPSYQDPYQGTYPTPENQQV